MASYQIEWKSSANKELQRLPKQIIGRVLRSVEQLANEPFPVGVTKLTGTDQSYRIRIGDYRVIYTVENEILRIEVIRVGHRKDVYR